MLGHTQTSRETGQPREHFPRPFGGGGGVFSLSVRLSKVLKLGNSVRSLERTKIRAGTLLTHHSPMQSFFLTTSGGGGSGGGMVPASGGQKKGRWLHPVPNPLTPDNILSSKSGRRGSPGGGTKGCWLAPSSLLGWIPAPWGIQPRSLPFLRGKWQQNHDTS